MSLTPEQVRRIAHLARLAVTPAEAEQVRLQLNDIFAMIERMQAVDTEGVAPMSHAQDVTLRLREDAITEGDQHERFQAVAPQVEGGFYQDGAYSGTTPRTDGHDWNGVSDWTRLEFALLHPLYTFGKIEHYGEAAQGKVDISLGELQATRADTVYDAKRAYFAFLTARDVRAFLEDMQIRLNQAIKSAERDLKEETGETRQSDLYALQTARGLLAKYVYQSRAVEKISLDGLKVLTGAGLKADLKVADARIEPVAFPRMDLAEFQSRALQDRPEMQQLEAGLRSRRALVAAKKADRMPDVYAGVIGQFNYASQRERLDNPYLNDPFNGGGLTPVVGVKWDSVFGVTSARVNQAQAELEALNHKKAFAVAGIPFEVGEAYANAQANYDAQSELAAGAAAARTSRCASRRSWSKSRCR